MSRIDILDEISIERDAQEMRFGEQSHPDGTGPDVEFCPPDDGGLHFLDWANDARMIADGYAQDGTLTWADIALEEIFEAMAESDEGLLRAELVQSAAVLVAWVEAIDRRG